MTIILTCEIFYWDKNLYSVIVLLNKSGETPVLELMMVACGGGNLYYVLYFTEITDVIIPKAGVM